VSRFPDIELNELDDEFGIGLGAKLIVIANNKKTIKFFDDVTSVSGLEKLNRKHLQPIIKKFSDPKFLQSVMKDMQKFAPNANLESMNEEEIMELMGEVMESPKMVKKYEKILKPYFSKFNREYDLDKYTILLIGDKKAKILDEIKDQDIDDLVQLVRDGLIEFYEESKDPSLKHLKNWQFKIKKNHNGNLYLYSNESLQSPYLSSRFYQEIFLTSHNDQMLLTISICVEKCNGSTDFLNIIKPSNLYVNSNPNIDASGSSDLTEQLKTLNELYKSGVLTKEEFTKAKKKLLN
jgi:glutamyl/glutaminyl-tRNA synthetase